MEWIEREPLPVECQNCNEEDCYNCDHALKRWYLSREDELLLKKITLKRSMERLCRKEQNVNKE